MALNTTNVDLISFKKLLGKAHTNEGFAANAENKSSNIQIAASTIFADNIDPTPVTGSNTLSAMYDSDGIVELIRLVVEPIPDTSFDRNGDGYVGRTQGWSVKLPSDYAQNSTALTKTGTVTTSGSSVVVTGSGTSFTDYKAGYTIYVNGEERVIDTIIDDTNLTVTVAFTGSNSDVAYNITKFSSGSVLYETLGNIQVVPPLYGSLVSGVNQYQAKLYNADGTANASTIGSGTEIDVLSEIGWNFDYYNGILFVQDPPVNNYDSATVRPLYLDAFIYVGDKISDKLATIGRNASTGATSGATLITELTDVANVLVANRYLRVNSAGNKVEFVSGPDLQEVLGFGNTISGDMVVTTSDSVILNSVSNSGMTIQLGTNGQSKFIDNRSVKSGMEYDADYSSGFTSRSLVDKAYVDSVAGSGSATGVLGTPADGSYDDGLLTLTTGTTVGTAVDQINEVLAALIQLPDNLSDYSTDEGTASFKSVKLSFGAENTTSTYDDNGGVLGVNDSYTIGGSRLGAVKSGTIAGTLNDQVADGNANGIPYLNDSFKNSESGILTFDLNGTTIVTADLSTPTAINTTSNGVTFNISAPISPKTQSGVDITAKKYRTGTYVLNLATAAVVNGYNTIDIYIDRTAQSLPNTTVATKDFIYDPNNISATELSTSVSATLAGDTKLSGVGYHTSGTLDITAQYGDVYTNVYYTGSDAIGIANQDNLASSFSSITISDDGSGNIPIPSNTRALPELLLGDNVENTIIEVDASIAIVPDNDYLINGTVTTGLVVKKPFSTLTTATNKTLNNILFNTKSSNSSDTIADMLDEARRIPDTNIVFNTTTYADIGSRTWDGSQTIQTTGNVGYLNGLQQVPAAGAYGKLIIPASNFNLINGPAGNPDYTTNIGAGVRTWVYRFRYTGGSTVSQPTFHIRHNGNASTFLTDGASSTPTPTLQKLYVEFGIIRGDDSGYGWYNPFATDNGTGDGVKISGSASHASSVTSVSTFLGSAGPRMQINDYLIFKVHAPATWTGYISEIEVEFV